MPLVLVLLMLGQTIELDPPAIAPAKVAIRYTVRFDIGNDGSVLYFQTNLDAPRKRVVKTDPANPGPDTWIDVTLDPAALDTL